MATGLTRSIFVHPSPAQMLAPFLTGDTRWDDDAIDFIEEGGCSTWTPTRTWWVL